MKVWSTLVYVRNISAHHEERLSACSHRQAKDTKGLDFSDFFTFHFWCLIVVFVIFVSPVVDTSPQKPHLVTPGVNKLGGRKPIRSCRVQLTGRQGRLWPFPGYPGAETTAS
jgi:hypothetical protein